MDLATARSKTMSGHEKSMSKWTGLNEGLKGSMFARFWTVSYHLWKPRDVRGEGAECTGSNSVVIPEIELYGATKGVASALTR